MRKGVKNMEMHIAVDAPPDLLNPVAIIMKYGKFLRQNKVREEIYKLVDISNSGFYGKIDRMSKNDLKRLAQTMMGVDEPRSVVIAHFVWIKANYPEIFAEIMKSVK